MEVIPAVDIRGGKLRPADQGDYRRETVFLEDPVAAALNWKAQGARRLHVVDLDGAAKGETYNLGIIEAIVKKTDLPVQLGGGIRDEAAVEKLLDVGLTALSWYASRRKAGDGKESMPEVWRGDSGWASMPVMGWWLPVAGLMIPK